MTTEIHAFEAKRISNENARLNFVMDEIFGIIKNCGFTFNEFK